MESGLFNNRELASLLWFAGIATWLLVRHRRSTVDAVRGLARAFRPVMAHFGLYGAWIAIVAVVGGRLGLWNVGLLKATVLWALLSGTGLFASTIDVLKGRRWFRRVIVSTIGATAVVEFFVNLKSFPLAIEIVPQPVVFLALVLPMVARDPEHQPVRTLAGWTSTLIGFLYLFTLYMAYEQLLKRMTWRAQGKSILRQRIAVVASGGPRLSVLRDLQGGNDYEVVHASGFVAAWRAIRQIRTRRRSERLEVEVSVPELTR